MWKNKNICGCHMSNDGKNNRQTNLLRLEKHDIALGLNVNKSLIAPKKVPGWRALMEKLTWGI